jgi:sugar/nucleoside kinase (ribokinase family)
LAEAIDVLCARFACYDLVFRVERHPGPDEKMFAPQRFDCGGGPAANAACAAAALCCCKFGARLGMPSHRAVSKFIENED